MTLKGCLDCLPALEKLVKVKNVSARRKLLLTCSKNIIYAISEIIRNILRGNIPITPKQRRKLNQYKDSLRELGKKSVTLKKRRQILNQKGGALAAAIIPALSFLSHLIAEKLF